MFDYQPGRPFREVATTGPNGFALQNGTPTILEWTAPNDGKLHVVLTALLVVVTNPETGGPCGIHTTGSLGVIFATGAH